MNIEPIAISWTGFESRLEFSRIEPLIYCRKTDFVVVAGTIVEGIGNPHSDFDVSVICDCRPTYFNGMSQTSWIEGEDGKPAIVGAPMLWNP